MTTGRSSLFAVLVALAGLAVCAPGRADVRASGAGGASDAVSVNSIGMKLVLIRP